MNDIQLEYPEKILVIANVPDTLVFKLAVSEFNIEYPIIVNLYDEFSIFNKKIVKNSFGFYKVDENGFFKEYKEFCDPRIFLGLN